MPLTSDTQFGQNQSPSGTCVSLGLRQYMWQPRSQPSHSSRHSSLSPFLQTWQVWRRWDGGGGVAGGERAFLFQETLDCISQHLHTNICNFYFLSWGKKKHPFIHYVCLCKCLNSV